MSAQHAQRRGNVPILLAGERPIDAAHTTDAALRIDLPDVRTCTLLHTSVITRCSMRVDSGQWTVDTRHLRGVCHPAPARGRHPTPSTISLFGRLCSSADEAAIQTEPFSASELAHASPGPSPAFGIGSSSTTSRRARTAPPPLAAARRRGESRLARIVSFGPSSHTICSAGDPVTTDLLSMLPDIEGGDGYQTVRIESC